MNTENRLTQSLCSGLTRNVFLAAGVVVLMQLPASAQYLPPSINLPSTLPGARRVLDSAQKTQNSSNTQTTKTNAAQTPSSSGATSKSSAPAVPKTQDEAAISAARQGHADSYKNMLESGANPAAVDKSQSTALHYAAYRGDLPMVNLILEQKGILLDARDSRGMTPAMLAAVADRDDALRLLIKAGCDTSLKASDGSSMLHQAARKGNLVVIRTLLEFGADPKAVDSHGHTASQVAEQSKKGQWEDAVKFLQAAETK